MVDFRPPAETGQQPYYQDHNARLEAQRRKAEATERRILETFPAARVDVAEARRCCSSAARRSSAWAIRK